MAFWIVFVIGGDIGRGLHDVIEGSLKARSVPNRRRAHVVELGARIAASTVRLHWVMDRHDYRSTSLPQEHRRHRCDLVNPTTGELLRALTLNPNRGYQPRFKK